MSIYALYYNFPFSNLQDTIFMIIVYDSLRIFYIPTKFLCQFIVTLLLIRDNKK